MSDESGDSLLARGGTSRFDAAGPEEGPMQDEEAERQPRAPSPQPPSTYPALSISKPPPRRDRVMTYILSGLFAAAFVLAIAAMVAHWLHAP
jgi:hypothetical protein